MYSVEAGSNDSFVLNIHAKKKNPNISVAH